MLNNKVIYDYTPFTHLDYPNHLSCIVWFSGCNMRCDYCYNKDIVFSKNGKYSYNDIIDFLKSRKNLLDAVVLSGGEATSHELVMFCKVLKIMGYKIKLDSNGTYFNQIKELIELGLVDYIALDYKAPKNKFTQITHSNKYEEFSNTLQLLLDKNFDFEVRTTLHSDLLNENDINDIIKDLDTKGYNKTYYIQEYLDTDSSIANLQIPTQNFDKSLLLDSLNIKFR